MTLRARSQPLVAVRDVRASARMYAELLGLERSSVQMTSDHDDVYDRLLDGEELVMQLHAWDVDDHPNLVDETRAPRGHGVLIWFEVDDFDAAVVRARRLSFEVVLEPHVNESPMHREIWLRDPDGYTVVLASPDGEAAPGTS